MRKALCQAVKLWKAPEEIRKNAALAEFATAECVSRIRAALSAVVQIPIIDRLNLSSLALDRRLDPFLDAAG